jgi:hypothetical protein
MMKRAIAKVTFLSTEEGGRTQPIPLMNFGCPVFFEGVDALSSHGYDCRLLISEYGAAISPGETVNELAMIFLYPEDVFPHLKIGVRFTLWEGRTIARGEISRCEQ